MSRGQLTALMAALAVGAMAPRLAAQDTAATRETRSDTSGYTGTAGIDTTAQPGRMGAMDSAAVGQDTLRRLRPDTVAGRAGRDSSGRAGAPDSSGMRGRHPRPTMPGDSTSAAPASSSDATSGSDSASVSQPGKQPGQSTSRTGDSASSTGP